MQAGTVDNGPANVLAASASLALYEQKNSIFGLPYILACRPLPLSSFADSDYLTAYFGAMLILS